MRAALGGHMDTCAREPSRDESSSYCGRKERSRAFILLASKDGKVKYTLAKVNIFKTYMLVARLFLDSWKCVSKKTMKFQTSLSFCECTFCLI